MGVFRHPKAIFVRKWPLCIDAALLLFGMQALPKTEAEINNAFKVAMRHAHPDRNFGTRAATEHAQRLLEARIVLKKAMLKGVGP